MSENVVQCRVRIEGTYQGVPWIFEDGAGSKGSQFIHDAHTADADPSTYWWQDGNFACDCNRVQFLPDELINVDEMPCGHTIKIDRIVPFDSILPTLELNETKGPQHADIIER